MLIARAKLKLKKLIMISKFYIYSIIWSHHENGEHLRTLCLMEKGNQVWDTCSYKQQHVNIFVVKCLFSDVIGHNTVIILKISHVQVDNNVTSTQKGSKSNNRFARRTKYINSSIHSLRALFLHICITDCRLELMLNSTVWKKMVVILFT